MGSKYAGVPPLYLTSVFADGSLLFVRTNEQEAQRVLDTLKPYELASGLVINVDKSEVSYSRNVPSNTLDMLHRRLGFKEVEAHDCYLGLPTIIG